MSEEKKKFKPVKLNPKFQKRVGILSVDPKIKKVPLVANSGTYKGLLKQTIGPNIEGWLEKPDIEVSDYTDMSDIEDNTYDHMIIPHTLERVWPWETIPILTECNRIMKKGGHIAIIIYILEQVGQALTEGDIHRTIHMPADGTAAMTPHTIMYGDPNKILKNTMYAHKQTFTSKWINSMLVTCKFKPVQQTQMDAAEVLIVGEVENG